MKTITPTPYQIEENLSGQVLRIIISKAVFEGVIHRDGKVAFEFVSFYFKKVSIVNDDEIEFPDITLFFVSCFIENVEVENITSKNIVINFHRSVIAGKINNSVLLGVEIGNCILINSLFLIGVQKVRIAFTKENIYLPKWKEFFSKINGEGYRYFLEAKQSYYIYDVQKVDFISNFSQLHRKRININLALKYSDFIGGGYAKVKNVSLKSLTIEGNTDGKISLENCKFNSWYLYDFTPENNASFYNILPYSPDMAPSIMSIHQCNLDKASFDNVNFRDFTRLSLYRSKLSGAIFTSCNFPGTYSAFEKFMPIENVHYPDKRQESYDKDQYEVLLQLKKSLEGTGNYFEAQKLLAVSQDALKKIKDIPFWDRKILWINKVSNNHGLSIGRPFGWFLLFSIGSYILYLWTLNRMFNCNPIDYTLIGYYFSFIDLTHRTDFLVDKTQFTSFSLMLDYLNKVFTGFFIFQFIAAFRKYGKR